MSRCNKKGTERYLDEHHYKYNGRNNIDTIFHKLIEKMVTNTPKELEILIRVACDLSVYTYKFFQHPGQMAFCLYKSVCSNRPTEVIKQFNLVRYHTDINAGCGSYFFLGSFSCVIYTGSGEVFSHLFHCALIYLIIKFHLAEV